MQHKNFCAAAVLLLLSAYATALTNETMNPEYRQLMYGDPVGAIHETYINQLGAWFFVMLILAPFFALYLYQQKLTMPTIWLITALAAYGYLLESQPAYVYYLVAVVWVMTALYRAVSPVYTD
jgi:hypothetical protein